MLWGELDRATQRFALATTGGMISHTGIAGLTLGGGLGNLMRRLGLTVDSLRSVDLVTAEGEPLHVSEETDAELFWGLRGGGGNFGIATSFEYRLHPVGPMVLGGPMLWPLADAPAREPLERALADYERRRNEASAETYQTTIRFARLKPPPPEMQRLFEALRDSPQETARFFGTVTGTVSAAEFFAPENVARIIGGSPAAATA